MGVLLQCVGALLPISCIFLQRVVVLLPIGSVLFQRTDVLIQREVLLQCVCILLPTDVSILLPLHGALLSFGLLLLVGTLVPVAVALSAFIRRKGL